MANNFDVWKDNIKEELDFWAQILSGTHPDKEWVERSLHVMTHVVPIFERLKNYIEIFPEKLIDIINVGSGPCAPLAITHPTRFIRMFNVDPLGDFYNKMIEDAGYREHTRIFPFAAENLHKDLPHNHFHIAWSNNALDHSWDPMTGIRNMVKITRPSGKIVITVTINEGERTKYSGLHRWNFRSNATGECELWNPAGELFNVNHELKEELSDINVSTLPNHLLHIMMTKR